VPTTAELALGGLAAFGAAEATGVTDVTGLGRQSDPSGGGDTPAGNPALGALLGEVGALRAQVARSGAGGGADVSRPSGDLEAGDVAELLAPIAETAADARDAASEAAATAAADAATDAAGAAADPNANAEQTAERIVRIVRTGGGSAGDSVIDTVTGGPGGSVIDTVTGGSGGSGGGDGGPNDGFGIFGGALGGFDPDRAGESIGTGTGEFIEGAVSETAGGVGEAVGGIPFDLVGGAIEAGGEAGNATRRVIADVTGAEGDNSGINADRPGAGITDVLDMVASGEQGDPPRTYTPGEAVGAIAETAAGGAADAAPDVGALADAADTSDAAAENTRDLAESVGDAIPDALKPNGGVSDPSGSTGGGANEATGSTSPSVGGGDPAGPTSDPDPAAVGDAVRRIATTGDTTSSGDTTREQDREQPDIPSRGGSRIGVIR
jgi:hypothetical protein